MPVRILGLGVVVLAVFGLAAWWLLDPGGPQQTGDVIASRDAEPGPAVVQRGDPSDEAARAADTAEHGPFPAQVTTIDPGFGVGAVERVHDLLADLSQVRGLSRSRQLVASRLADFVADVVAADQESDAIAVLRHHVDGDRGHDDWVASRLYVALAGLGAHGEVVRSWRELPRTHQPDVIAALAWDPLGDGEGLALDLGRVDAALDEVAELPLELGRLPGPGAGAMLRRLAQGEDESVSRRVRRTALIAWGVGVDRNREVAAELGRLAVEEDHVREVAMYVLMQARGESAAAALADLRLRFEPGAEEDEGSDRKRHERVALDLARLEARLHGDALADIETLCGRIEDRGSSVQDRLGAAGGVLARIVGSETDGNERARMSDALSTALRDETDADVAWTELLALVQLHSREALSSSMSVGYGSERSVDQARAEERVEAFMLRLADSRAANRRLAVIGLFNAGSADQHRVDDALGHALRRERDERVARWMRLALHVTP